MRAADLPVVAAIAAAVHPGHPERPEVFAERLALAPAGCHVLEATAGAVSGYAVTHPWLAEAPPPLDALLGTLPEAGPGAVWHIHDIALLPEARGAGHAAALLGRLLAAAARGFAGATLVALAGKAGYWERHGFRPVAPRGGAAGAAALGTYGAGATFMARALA